jgi:hypothetical protein
MIKIKQWKMLKENLSTKAASIALPQNQQLPDYFKEGKM